MLSWLRNLLRRFAGPAAPALRIDDEEAERFCYEKQESLERVLGPMHDLVGHAIIPFVVGGAVDMYVFPHALPGTAFVTQELVTLGEGQKPSKIGNYELIAFTRHAPIVAEKGATPTPFELIERRFGGIFAGLANYSFQTVLNPLETCEVPGGNEGPALLLLDEFVPSKGEFRIVGRRYGLMLCIEIHPSELAFARKNGSRALLNRLKEAGHYPYSDLDRPQVV